MRRLVCAYVVRKPPKTGFLDAAQMLRGRLFLGILTLLLLVHEAVMIDHLIMCLFNLKLIL